MSDPHIKVGDVVHDLVERGKMQVVAKAADSVAEHREREGYDLANYKSHPLLGVTDDETVWTCVYLPDSPTASFSGTYDFPESRLARVPVENANQDLERVQAELVETVLVNLLLTAHDYAYGDISELVKDAGVPEEIVDRAAELADTISREDGGESA